MQVLLEQPGMRDRLLHADADQVRVALKNAGVDGLDVIEHDLQRRDPAPADHGQEALRNDALQAVAQL
jgi:hypothetical protein